MTEPSPALRATFTRLLDDRLDRLADGPLRDEQQGKAEEMESSLRAFIPEAWKVVEPRRPFVPNWHIDALADHLQAVTAGEITRLIVNMPPRFMKSLSICVFWFVWSWLRRPDTRWICASYAQRFARRDSMKSRKLIQSPWFQHRWGDRFQLSVDENTKDRFANDHTGVRIAGSMGGLMGEGGDFLVIDDPHDLENALSDRQREATITQFDEELTQRLNDPMKSAIVVDMQRLHENDLVGHLLEQGGYIHLRFPMEFEKAHRCTTPLGFSDPRNQEGELLWPKRSGAKQVAEMKMRLGPVGYACQGQQRPVPREGALFKADRFQVVDEVPPAFGEHRKKPTPFSKGPLRYWDKAATKDAGAYTAGVKIAQLWDGRWIVLDARRGRWATDEREREIRSTAESDGVGIPVRIEQEPGSGGKESAEATVRNLSGFVVTIDRVTGDKVERADPWSVQVNQGNALLLRAPWNDAYIAEHRLFPRVKIKDQVDASSGGFNHLAGAEHESDEATWGTSRRR